ncbi:MAG TPA: hypothetical protein VLI69_03155 [Gammaproteobacteria bacterium]|nr:hypothetical protein [Gammaproteobacteria bacterium]
MHPDKELHSIEQVINNSLEKFGIPDAKITVSLTTSEAIEATISYQDKKAKILFTKEEIGNLKKGNISTDTKRKIYESIVTIAPRTGPPFKAGY